ncbi:MAG: ribosomal protein S18-alanine N-acetyltransferase [Turicibacter sp.]|nr:ribosomal protein S18-alanine N-acetyltransferase [Turicibacter sp.]
MITEMTAEHIEAISGIEADTTWSKSQLLQDMQNKHAIYYVALRDGMAVGYIGIWHILNEGQILNIAVAKAYRRQNIASALLATAIETAKKFEMLGLTLEVRESNIAAKKLYEKHGFAEEGRRKNYYEKPAEDALIMWLYL